MSRDRQTFRAFFLVMGIVCWSLSTGCLRSTVLRKDDGPAARPALTPAPSTFNPTNSPPGPAAPAAAGAGNSVLVPAVPAAKTAPAEPAAAPPVELQAAPTSVQDQTTLSPVVPAPVLSSPPVTAPVEQEPAGKPTPLLDAAIERVTAATRVQREALDSTPPPAEPDAVSTTTVTPASPTLIPTAPEERPTAPPPLANASEASPTAVPATIRPAGPTAPPPMPVVPDTEPPQTGSETPTAAGLGTAVDAAASTDETQSTLLATEPPAADRPAADDDRGLLGVGKFCLCRKIVGFGSFEPLQEPRVKVGKRIFLYCEMTGMQYQPKEASFVARLSSKIEIGSVDNGTHHWAYELGPKDDVCASRRRDFFVSYRFCLPQTLPPGSYRLRLTQTDLVANRTASAEIPLEIVP